MALKLKKSVSRTYQLKDWGFYKVQFEYEEDLEEYAELDISDEYKCIGQILDDQLQREKSKLGL